MHHHGAVNVIPEQIVKTRVTHIVFGTRVVCAGRGEAGVVVEHGIGEHAHAAEHKGLVGSGLIASK